MTGWFGKSWGAPVCDPLEHQPTPVGIMCRRCRIPIEAGDEGLTLMGVEDAAGSLSTTVLHLACFAASIRCPGCPRCKPERAEQQLDGRLN